MSIDILKDSDSDNSETLRLDMEGSTSTFADLEGLVKHYKTYKRFMNGKLSLKDPVFTPLIPPW